MTTQAKEPTRTVPAEELASDTVLAINGLRTHFHTDEGVVKAVDGVDLVVPRGRTLCVVGESGCGKSMTARSILGLVAPPGKIVDGRIQWRPELAEPAVDLVSLDPNGEPMRKVRGGQIGMVFQEPMASLSPMYTIGAQLIEAIRLHLPLSADEAREKAIADLARVGIPQPERRIDSYPFQLSGGMNQRAMIAIAISCDPKLLIADEPTTALDVTTQAQILDLLTELQDETGMAMMFITHDLGVVAEIADDVAVMYLGTVAERGRVTDIFDSPQHPYTQALLESIPAVGTDARSRLRAISGMVPHPSQRPDGCPFHTRCPSVMPGLCDTTPPAEHVIGGGRTAACHLLDPDLIRPAPESADSGAVRSEPEAADLPAVLRSSEPAEPAAAEGAVHVHPAVAEPMPGSGSAPAGTTPPLLEVRGLQMRFAIKQGFLNRTVGHVRAVDDVDLTIYPGETLGLVGESGCGKTTLGRCIARALKPTTGAIRYRDGSTGEPADLAQLSTNQLRPYRQQIRMIFQDPFTSLNPRMTLLQLIAEPLRQAGGASRLDSTVQDQVADMLLRVGLRPEYLRRYPHAFSGGERQRVNIARALITNPRLVIADEAVSALDVSVRAQILNLLRDLQDDFGLTYLFISHDLSVVEHLCDRVAVMYLGRIVEQAATDDVFTHPRHPYTEALLSAVPVPDPRLRDAGMRGNGHRIRLEGDLPDATNPPAGCPFHTRCPHHQPTLCDTDRPILAELTSGSQAACHYTDQLTLRGIAGAAG